MLEIVNYIQKMIDEGIVTEEELNAKIEEMRTTSNLTRIEERTAGLQDIDDFTLQQLMSLQQRVDDLENRVTILEGGTV